MVLFAEDCYDTHPGFGALVLSSLAIKVDIILVHGLRFDRRRVCGKGQRYFRGYLWIIVHCWGLGGLLPACYGSQFYDGTKLRPRGRGSGIYSGYLF